MRGGILIVLFLFSFLEAGWGGGTQVIDNIDDAREGGTCDRSSKNGKRQTTNCFTAAKRYIYDTKSKWLMIRLVMKDVQGNNHQL